MNITDVCKLWQEGGNENSGAIRGGARLLTGVPHYFEADFITEFEQDAEREPKFAQAARALLKTISDSESLTAAEWGSQHGVDGVDVAVRGISGKPGPIDDQIDEVLSSGSIDMPLWGASLKPDVAAMFGRRFSFVLDGPFQAVPAWVHSGEKTREYELIMSGRYEVVDYDVSVQDGKTEAVAKIRQVGGFALL